MTASVVQWTRSDTGVIRESARELHRMRWAGNPHSWGNFAGAWASGRSNLYFSQSRIRGDEGPSKLNGALPTDRRLTCRVVSNPHASWLRPELNCSGCRDGLP